MDAAANHFWPAVPILLLWVYLVWVIVLLGAAIAAYALGLRMRVAARPATPGWRFELALPPPKDS